ncbi:MAG: hypothetical protein WBD20_16425 [Pirellulaceae bacterium]
MVKRLISVLLVFHLLAFGMSMAAGVATSETQLRLNGLLRPYTMPTHFRTQGEPVYLATGDLNESPHRLQVLRVSADDDKTSVLNQIETNSQWETIAPKGIAGLASNDRYVRWISTLVTLVENESPSLVAELLLPFVRADDSISAVRIIRLPTNLSLITDIDPTTQYVAAVSRVNNAVSLVQINEPRLRTMPIGSKSTQGKEASNE